jgi:hypothetical protein
MVYRPVVGHSGTETMLAIRAQEGEMDASGLAPSSANIRC